MSVRWIVSAFLAVVAAAAIAGCGGGDDASDRSEGATSTPGGHLAGRYAHYDVVAYEGELLKTLIISYGFTDLTVDDGELVAKESFCHADQETDQPIETSISDEATQAIKPRKVAVEVSTKDGRTSFFRPETPTGIGIDLEDPANDVLPDDPNDPRIADDDNDGNPGITVRIKVTDTIQGELYIARRERFAYDVAEQADRSLTGTVEDHSEQLILGATDPIFITKDTWKQVPDRAKSPIILKPVAKNWDCTRLMAERDNLFPPAPVVDW